MPRKKKTLSFAEKMHKLHQAGLSDSQHPNADVKTDEPILSLEQRIDTIFHIINNPKKRADTMTFFIMYDIESNKVRRHVVKYLEKKGCTRIQRSIFLADLNTHIYHEIRNDLVEVQACYENNDSIMVVPISADFLRSMKIIGKSINIDIITHNKNTLFF